MMRGSGDRLHRALHLKLSEGYSLQASGGHHAGHLFGPDGLKAPFGFARMFRHGSADERGQLIRLDGVSPYQGANSDQGLGRIGNRDPGAVEMISDRGRRHLRNRFAGELPGKIGKSVATNGVGDIAKIDFI